MTDVPPGYKQTEVGVIPEDWFATQLPDVIWFQEGPGLRKWQFRSAGLKVINVTNLQTNGYLDTSNTDRHISWEEFERTYKHFLVDEGDVVVASSGNSYCKTAVVRGCDLPLLMNTSVIRFKAKPSIDHSYMLVFLKSAYFKNQIDLMITGGAQPNFGPFHLRKVIIPLPPTKAEQEAIAEALSDADALIESLEHLIAKKRQVKQGAMQELLTGKRRLPGFGGEWEVKRFGEFVYLRNDRVDPRRSGPFEFCVELEHIGQGTGCLIGFTSTSETSSLKSTFQNGDVLFGKLRAYLRKYWLADRDGVCSTEIWVLAARHSAITPEYLFQLVMVDRFVEIASTAYGTHMPRSDWAVVKNFEVNLPTLAEQTAIAAILSDMDAEITALESKLAKARQVKQGMMQELLTGRIRLV